MLAAEIKSYKMVTQRVTVVKFGILTFIKVLTTSIATGKVKIMMQLIRTAIFFRIMNIPKDLSELKKIDKMNFGSKKKMNIKWNYKETKAKQK